MKALPDSLADSSSKQLQTLIDTAIANNPWNDYDLNDPLVTFDQRLTTTITKMRSKGFRPITVEEYRLQLRQGGAKGQIHLWRALEGFDKNSFRTARPGLFSSPPTPTGTEESLLPLSKEQVTEDLAAAAVDGLLFEDDSHGGYLATSVSQLDTEEWPVAHQTYDLLSNA